MKQRIIAVNSNCYHGFSIEEAIEGIAAAGFHTLLMTGPPGTGKSLAAEAIASKLEKKIIRKLRIVLEQQV